MSEQNNLDNKVKWERIAELQRNRWIVLLLGELYDSKPYEPQKHENHIFTVMEEKGLVNKVECLSNSYEISVKGRSIYDSITNHFNELMQK